MDDAIIVLNAGSSSLKFSVFEADKKLPLVAHGQIEGLGTAPRFVAKNRASELLAESRLSTGAAKFGHDEAFAYLADWLREHYSDRYKPFGVGHRIVHGGAEFVSPVRIDAGVRAELEKIIPLVPLHQPHNLAAVDAVSRLMPHIPQVACFDTSFHQGRSKVTQRYGLPELMFQQGIRRWGFHGLSYEAIARRLPQVAPDLVTGRTIVAHLGSGASLCAMRNGKSIDTTMGFSALDGLPMGTRCGGLDPGIILFLLQKGLTAAAIEDLLYKKCGLLGISGVSNDVRDLLKSDVPLAAEALEYFVYRTVREIGSLAAALGGLDALIFTAGIGENSAVIRERICNGLAWLGITLDPRSNQRNDTRLSPLGRTPSVWVIPTDEEGVIASHTLNLLSSK